MPFFFEENNMVTQYRPGSGGQWLRSGILRTTLKNGTKHDVSGSLRFQFKLHLADMYRRCSQGNNGALSRPKRGYSCNNEVTCTLHTDLRIPTTRSTITKETEHVRHLLQALSLPLLFAHVHNTQFCTCFTLGAVHEGTPGKDFRVFDTSSHLYAIGSDLLGSK